MDRKAIRIFLLTLIVGWQSACGTDSQNDCAKHVREEIHPGLSSDVADALLKKCGFKTTIDHDKKTLYGDKRTGRGPVFERTQVVIGLNSDNTVATITVRTALIGP
jgi:hypothetical protein